MERASPSLVAFDSQQIGNEASTGPAFHTAHFSLWVQRDLRRVSGMLLHEPVFGGEAALTAFKGMVGPGRESLMPHAS